MIGSAAKVRMPRTTSRLRWQCLLWIALLLGTLALAQAQQPTASCDLATSSPQFVWTRHSGQQPTGNAQIVIPQMLMADCRALCVDNLDAVGDPFLCVGFDFVSATGTCMLSAAADDLDYLDIVNNADAGGVDQQAFDGDDGLADLFRPLDEQSVLDAVKQWLPGGQLPAAAGRRRRRQVSPAAAVAVRPLLITRGSDRAARFRAKRQLDSGFDSFTDERGAYNSSDTTGYYEKICFRAVTARSIPTASLYTFERRPNRVLLEATEEVVIADTVAQCLGACLDARELFDIECRSVMYYSDTRDCLLNSMDTRTASNALSDDTESFRVDYYENHVPTETCGLGTVTQYSRLHAHDVRQAVDRHLIAQISRNSCQNFCTANRLEDGTVFMCRSFAYHLLSKECHLMHIQPTQHPLSSTVPNEHVQIYEKICLSAERTCIRSPAFERQPAHVLVGFTQVVLENARSPQRCLNECTQSSTTLGFVCMSVMYYADSKECVLNYDSAKRGDNLQQLSATNASDVRVDYYDSLCAVDAALDISANACPPQFEATYIEYPRSQLDSASLVYSGVSLLDCLHSCEVNANFTCRSVDYSEPSETCALSYENGDSQPLLPAAAASAAHYDRRCVHKAQYTCGGMGVSYTATPDHMLPGESTLKLTGVSLDECLALCLQDPTKKCVSVNYARLNSSCELNEALADGGSRQLAQSDGYSYYVNHCSALSQTQPVVSNDAEFHVDSTKIDRSSRQPSIEEPADQLLQPPRLLERRQSASPLITSDCRYGSMRVTLNADQPFNGYLFAKNKFSTCRSDIVDSSSGSLLMTLPGPSYYAGQAAAAYGQQPAYHSHVPGECGVVQTARGVYSAVVVVAMNNLGIPGLVTAEDTFYNVTCDYQGQLHSKVEATGPAITVSNAANIIAELQPDGRIYIPSPLSVALKRDAAPVQTAMLGEQLTLTFDYVPEFRHDLIGVFIRECNASRAQGYSQQPQPLMLVGDGCPMPEVQRAIITGPITETPTGFEVPFSVFKFDGGNSVRISCAVDLCEGGCNPTSCMVNGQTQMSFGRKKRSADSSVVDASNETLSSFAEVDGDDVEVDNQPSTAAKSHRRRTVRTNTKSLIFTVVEKLPQNHHLDHRDRDREHFEDEASVKQVKTLSPPTRDDGDASGGALDARRLADQRSHARQDLLTEFRSTMRARRQLCLRRHVFVCVFTALALMCLAQVACIGTYLIRKWLNEPTKKLKF